MCAGLGIQLGPRQNITFESIYKVVYSPLMASQYIDCLYTYLLPVKQNLESHEQTQSPG